MKKILAVSAILFSALFGAEKYAPVQQIHTDGAAKDIVVRGNHLIIGTDNGKLQVYDYLQKKW